MQPSPTEGSEQAGEMVYGDISLHGPGRCWHPPDATQSTPLLTPDPRAPRADCGAEIKPPYSPRAGRIEIATEAAVMIKSVLLERQVEGREM